MAALTPEVSTVPLPYRAGRVASIALTLALSGVRPVSALFTGAHRGAVLAALLVPWAVGIVVMVRVLRSRIEVSQDRIVVHSILRTTLTRSLVREFVVSPFSGRRFFVQFHALAALTSVGQITLYRGATFRRARPPKLEALGHQLNTWAGHDEQKRRSDPEDIAERLRTVAQSLQGSRQSRHPAGD